MSHRNSSTQQACAACKYQRRKCAPDCILAPYFPHDRQHQFLNAHKLFGVSNITKIIKNLQPNAQYEAMQSIIFQSDARALDPVGGCYRIIRELEREIELLTAEYRFVCQQLAIYRAQEQQQQSQSHSQLQPSNDVVSPHYALYYQHQHQQDHGQNNHNQFVQQPHDHQEQYMRIMEENGQPDHDHNGDNLQEDDPNTWVMHDSTLSLLNIKDQFVNHCDGGDVRNHDGGEMKPILQVSNDHYERSHLIFEDEKTIQHSDRNGLNEERPAIPKQENAAFKHEQEQHDFEVAAANLFPLTSCISSEYNETSRRSV